MNDNPAERRRHSRISGTTSSGSLTTSKELCPELDAGPRDRLGSTAGMTTADHEGTETGERARLIKAFSKAAAEHGYRSLTVDHVTRHAGLSRERFEAHFASRELGLIAAQDAFLDRLWSEVTLACAAAEEWPSGVRLGLGAVLGVLVEASPLARVFMVEATAASIAAAERQYAFLGRFADLLREGRERYPRAASMPEATERILIGGAASIVCECLLVEEPGTLPSLEPELVATLLTPYLGEEEALRVAPG
jgi:AcrR family transcriptional regulator